MKEKKYLKKILICFVLFFAPFYTTLAQPVPGNEVNTIYDERNPVWSPDRKTFYFTRAYHPENIGGKTDRGDIWYTDLTHEGKLGIPQNIGAPVNDGHYNAIIGFSPDGSQMYLLNNYDKHAPNNNVSKGVAVSYKRGSGWSVPEKLEIPYFNNKSDKMSGSLSLDGKVMLLSIDSYGTQGLEDIYVSFLRADKSWSEPKNLGININSQYHEMTPFLAQDRETLFFASNGHGGYGGRDIFMSKRLDDSWTNWSEPVNLGSKVNTEGVELSCFMLDNTGLAYYTSTKNSDGYGDIKVTRLDLDIEEYVDSQNPEDSMSRQSVDIPILAQQTVEITPAELVPGTEKVTQVDKEYDGFRLLGKVLNAKDKKAIYASLTAVLMPEGEVFQEAAADSETGYFILLEKGKTYKVYAKSKGYLTGEKEINLLGGGNTSEVYNFQLTPLEVGLSVQLSNVLFERGTSELLDGSYQELDKVVEMMKDHPNIHIALGGHTDNTGNSRLNLKLSRERVEVVKAYLISQGLSQDRIEGRGYGGTKPIASNKSEETRKLNRRVEFKIIKK